MAQALRSKLSTAIRNTSVNMEVKEIQVLFSRIQSCTQENHSSKEIITLE
jgi:hypothetical protein